MSDIIGDARVDDMETREKQQVDSVSTALLPANSRGTRGSKKQTKKKKEEEKGNKQTKISVNMPASVASLGINSCLEIGPKVGD